MRTELSMATVDSLLNGLRAAAEATRLRLLALCAEGELTVTELTRIMGQSQPRVSRHLKVLCEAGLLERYQERSWVFYRIARQSEAASLASTLIRLVPRDDATMALDRERLAEVKRARASQAAEYFKRNAAQWDAIRTLYVPEQEVEDALLRLAGDKPIRDMLDIGTGTGRVLQLFAERADRVVGVDLLHEMLAVARVNLENARIRNCEVRHGDMYKLAFPTSSFDLVTIHMVLHFADNPGAAIAEAGRVLRPGGRLVIVDFAPHELEFLRDEHAHRRLGFAETEVTEWLTAAGLEPINAVKLPGERLTIVLWPAVRSNVTQLPGRMIGGMLL